MAIGRIAVATAVINLLSLLCIESVGQRAKNIRLPSGSGFFG
jgi:hypothetical protein